MTENNIKRAVLDAKRFLAAADMVLKESVKDCPAYGDFKAHRYLEHGKRTGALRRASMDLTRTLAEMRRSG